MPIEKITIVGTGLIGASIGLALYRYGFSGWISGIDTNVGERTIALQKQAISEAAVTQQQERLAVQQADVIVLAMPVLGILNWMERHASLLRPGQLVTDVGSTKLRIAEAAQRLMPGQFLPGHPMAGKESGGAALGEANLFQRATWLFTPLGGPTHSSTPIEAEWRTWVERFGANILDMDPERHDELCAWVSHLPQMVSTAMSALLEDTLGNAPELRAIGGRALREMTRLGSSPFSMWRDIAHTNEASIATTLLALEQRLAHLRDNLRTPELRKEFTKANRFKTGGET